MDPTRRREGPAGWPGAGGTVPAFAAFVVAHEGCTGEVEEARLDDGTPACRCVACDEARLSRSGGLPGGGSAL